MLKFSFDCSQWYIESSAQWYMSTYDSNKDVMTFVESGAIVANPQLGNVTMINNKCKHCNSDDKLKPKRKRKKQLQHKKLFLICFL